MTVSMLYKSVAQLGFEDSLEDDARFILAANRALLQVNALRPATSACVINHKPLKNKVSEATFDPIEKTDELFFCAEKVKSYYFEADGSGYLYIEKYEESADTWVTIGIVELSGAHNFTAYRGFIKQDGAFTDAPVRLHFVGDYLYSVKCVAMYEHLYSANEADIPAYEPYTKYDISALVPDFLGLASPPIIEAGGMTKLNQGFDIENGRTVLLPRDAKGVFKVIYKRKPTEIEDTGEASDNEATIDLDEDLCALLPVLIASYVWVDDEPEKANYYLALYSERAADIEKRNFNATPVPMKSTNGW